MSVIYPERPDNTDVLVEATSEENPDGSEIMFF